MSAISEREHMPGWEDHGLDDPAAAALTGAREHEQAGSAGDHGDDKDKGAQTASLKVVGHVEHVPQKHVAGDNQENSESELFDGESRKRLQPVGIAGVGYGAVSALVAAAAMGSCPGRPLHGRGPMEAGIRISGLWLSALAVWLTLACAAASGAHAQRVATPEARSFAVRTDDGEYLTIAVAEPLTDADTGPRIGFAVQCERASGRLAAFLSFGTVPAGKPVQAAAGRPERVERFGPVVRGGGPAAGFHSPTIAERTDALRFVEAAFVSGALVSNGHNSVWNRIGEAENRAARAALRRCAGAGG